MLLWSQSCSSVCAPSRKLWGSNGRIGLRHCPAPLPVGCWRAKKKRKKAACHQHRNGDMGRSISKSHRMEKILLDLAGLKGGMGWASFFFCPPFSSPPLTHFPRTLFQAPGEYSPSCQCDVAHRGNHAAFSGLGAACSVEKMQL